MSRLEEQLTAVRVIVPIVVRASAELPLGLNVRRYAGLDLGPQGLALGVVREQRRGLPYCGEVIDELARGSVVVRRALEIGICDIGRRSVTGEQGEMIGG